MFLNFIFFLSLYIPLIITSFFFFFNDTATTEIYTLSLHDALPIYASIVAPTWPRSCPCAARSEAAPRWGRRKDSRSEEHTSELQSQSNLVCRLLLEKKKKKQLRQVLIVVDTSHRRTYDSI